MREETNIEETRKLCKANNREERIEHKLDMLFEELLDFRESFNYVQSQQFIEKLKREKRGLEEQLSDKASSIQNIDNNMSNSYRERYEKLNRFRGINN